MENTQRFALNYHNRRIFELGVSLLIGLLLGLLVVTSPLLPLSSDMQKLVLVIPFLIVVVILFNNMNRLILFAIAISVPLNLDFSIITSPYGRGVINMAAGRTIMALTGLRISLVLLLVLIGYALWLVERHGAHQGPVRYYPKVSQPAVGLIIISIISMYRAQDIQLSFFKVAQLVELFLVYFYVANHIRTKGDIQFFLAVLTGGLFAESLLMLVQWRTGLSFIIAGIDAFYNPNSGRPGGTLGSPNTAGVIISAELVIICAMLWYLPKRSQRVLATICFLVCCVALISTSGRAAWGGFVVAIICFMYLSSRHGWVQNSYMVGLLMAILAIGAIFYPVIQNRFTEDDNYSAASRPMMFRLAWKMIQASPANFLFGVGSNNYALVAPAYNTVVGGAMGYAIQDTSVHNVYLLTWAETGLLGLLCLLNFMITLFVIIRKHIRSYDRFISLVSIGLGCALIVMNIQMFVDPFIARPKIIFLWLLTALIASLSNLESNRRPTHIKNRHLGAETFQKL